MNIIKRHKGLAVICLLTIILLVVIFLILSRMIFNKNNSTYGDRLNALVEIDKSTNDKIISEYKEKKEISDINIRTQGRIIYATIKVNEGTKLDKAKELAEKIISYYNEEVISYYDFGFFLEEVITSKEDTKGFIITGTKHPDNEKVSWIK